MLLIFIGKFLLLSQKNFTHTNYHENHIFCFIVFVYHSSCPTVHALCTICLVSSLYFCKQIITVICKEAAFLKLHDFFTFQFIICSQSQESYDVAYNKTCTFYHSNIKRKKVTRIDTKVCHRSHPNSKTQTLVTDSNNEYFIYIEISQALESGSFKIFL